MNLIHKASGFFKEAHKSQKRWDGSSYFTHHLEPVAKYLDENWAFLFPEPAVKASWSRQNTGIWEAVLAAAYGHDYFEDVMEGDIEKGSEILTEQGFPVLTIDLIASVTKPKGMSYYDFIGKIVNHSVGARAIKCSDLWSNGSSKGHPKHMLDKYRFAYHLCAPSHANFPPF